MRRDVFVVVLALCVVVVVAAITGYQGVAALAPCFLAIEKLVRALTDD